MSKAIRLLTFPKPKYGEQIVAVENDSGMNIALFDAVDALRDCTMPGVSAKDTAKHFAELLVAQVNAAAQLLEALQAQSEIITRAQSILTSFLVPGGISEEVCIVALLGHLDGPEQRAALALSDAAIAAATNQKEENRYGL